MNIRQILLILKLRWWLVLSLVAASLVVAGLYLWKAPRAYIASSALIVDLKTDPLLNALAPAMAAPAYMATQVEILQSERLATRVVKELKLSSNENAVARWREETASKIPIETYYGQMLQKGLGVQASTKGSHILNLSFGAEDPNFAALVANTFAKSYIDLSVELRTGPAKENATFFEDRLKKLRSDLEAAQAKVAAFQQSKGVVISNDRFDQEMARLQNLESAYAAALAEAAATSSVARNSGTESSMDVSQSASVQNLRAQLATAETRLAEASLTLGVSHPTRIQLDTQIRELKEQLARETRVVSGTSANVNRVASAKMGELRGLVEAQKRTVLNLRAVRDEGSLLLKELELAQKAFESVNSRRSQLSLESQSANAGARVLSEAIAPLDPASPKVPVVLGVALVAGLLLGVGAAVGWEMLDRRVRSVQDLGVAEGVPVLGVLSNKRGTKHPVRVGGGVGLLTAPSKAAPRLTMNEG